MVKCLLRIKTSKVKINVSFKFKFKHKIINNKPLAYPKISVVSNYKIKKEMHNKIKEKVKLKITF